MRAAEEGAGGQSGQLQGKRAGRIASDQEIGTEGLAVKVKVKAARSWAAAWARCQLRARAESLVPSSKIHYTYVQY